MYFFVSSHSYVNLIYFLKFEDNVYALLFDMPKLFVVMNSQYDL